MPYASLLPRLHHPSRPRPPKPPPLQHQAPVTQRPRRKKFQAGLQCTELRIRRGGQGRAGASSPLEEQVLLLLQVLLLADDSRGGGGGVGHGSGAEAEVCVYA